MPVDCFQFLQFIFPSSRVVPSSLQCVPISGKVMLVILSLSRRHIVYAFCVGLRTISTSRVYLLDKQRSAMDQCYRRYKLTLSHFTLRRRQVWQLYLVRFRVIWRPPASEPVKGTVPERPASGSAFGGLRYMVTRSEVERRSGYLGEF